MNVVAVPSNDPRVAAELNRLRQPGAVPGYKVVGYTSLDDLLTQLRKLVGRGDCIETLEIDAHGNPSVCNGITAENAQNVGEQLGLLNKLCPDCKIYLSGCNTGLAQGTMFPLPKLLAMSTNCTVFGSVGYLSGTHAEGTERTTRDTHYRDRYYPPYPGSQNQTGSGCYRSFTRYG
jgi:hypothetical protein